MSRAGLSAALALCEDAKLVLKKEIQSLRVETKRLREERDEAHRAWESMREDYTRSLKEENEPLRLAKRRNVRKESQLKVGARGGVSLYGFGRYPVTLYMDQWIKVLLNVRRIQAFIVANEAQLS